MSCHRLAVNNVNPPGPAGNAGTALTWAPAATTSNTWSWWKSLDSEFSPRWMPPPGPNDYLGGQSPYVDYASFYANCASEFMAGTPQGIPPFDVSNPPAGCAVTPLGVPWDDGTGPINDGSFGPVGPTSRTLVGSVHTMTAAGTDIYGTTDQGMFSYVGITGDGAATVKVTSISPNNPPTDPYAKAGLMFRNGIGADAPHVMQSITPSGAQFQYRPDFAAQTTSSTPVVKSIPTWLRVIRVAPSSDSSRTISSIGRRPRLRSPSTR